MSSNLNSDAGPVITPAEQARALHRVVRAMHDGHCPRCGSINDSESMKALDPTGWRCPECGFRISMEEGMKALEAFQPYQQANLFVFEEWRQKTFGNSYGRTAGRIAAPDATGYWKYFPSANVPATATVWVDTYFGGVIQVIGLDHKPVVPPFGQLWQFLCYNDIELKKLTGQIGIGK